MRDKTSILLVTLVAIVAITGVIGITTQTNAQPSSNQAIAGEAFAFETPSISFCMDPDGRNTEVEGTTRSESRRYTDYCGSRDVVIEYLCDGRQLTAEKIPCEDECYRGTCTEAKPDLLPTGIDFELIVYNATNTTNESGIETEEHFIYYALDVEVENLGPVVASGTICTSADINDADNSKYVDTVQDCNSLTIPGYSSTTVTMYGSKLSVHFPDYENMDETFIYSLIDDGSIELEIEVTADSTDVIDESDEANTVIFSTEIEI